MKQRYRWLWPGIGLVLLFLVFSPPLSPQASRTLQQGWQLGHIFLFMVWGYLLLPSLQRRISHPLRSSLVLLVGCVLVGFMIELLQSRIGREFSLRDLLLDIVGTLLALSLYVCNGWLHLPAWPKRILYGLTFTLCIYALLPFTFAVLDELNMRRNFPRLADFDSALELDRWRGEVDIVRLRSSKGDEKVLQVQLDTDHFSGISLAHFHTDWRNYQQLKFEIFNPDSTVLTLTIRIHDDKHYGPGNSDYHDRFNRQLQIETGWNSISIDLQEVSAAPQSRAMDLARIQEIGLFGVDLPKSRIVYIDALRLTN